MNTENCSQAENLVAYLYGEASEVEKKSFERHLSVCDSCRGELKAFGIVRESVVTWRDEILSLPITPTIAPVAASSIIETRKRSALAAIREFFSLSPAWLRGATAFATIAFLALTVFAVVQLFGKKEESIVDKGLQPIEVSPSKSPVIESDKNKLETVVATPDKTYEKEHANKDKEKLRKPVNGVRSSSSSKQESVAKKESVRKKQTPRLSNSEIYDTAMYNDEDDSLRLSSMLETIND